MITKLGLAYDDFKAKFIDIKLVPEWDEGKQEWKNIVLTEELLKEWENSDLGIIVDVEQIDECPWNVQLTRLTFPDGHIQIEPFYKLFPIKPMYHKLLRNMLLVYTDSERWVKSAMDSNRFLDEKKARGEWAISVRFAPLQTYELYKMLCRRLDINMMQARNRISNMERAEKWWEMLEGRLDSDLQWHLVM